MAKYPVLIVIASVLGAFSLGCAGTKGPAFQAVAPSAGKAIVYVYRPGNDMSGSGITLKIQADGKHIGALRNEGYLYTSVTPGRHVISSKTEATSEVPFDAVAGRSYYIESTVVYGLFMGRPKLTMVPEETGRMAILGCKHAAPPKTETASAANANKMK